MQPSNKHVAYLRRILSTVVSGTLICALSEAGVDNDEILRFSILKNWDSISISIAVTECSMARTQALFISYPLAVNPKCLRWALQAGSRPIFSNRCLSLAKNSLSAVRASKRSGSHVHRSLA